MAQFLDPNDPDNQKKPPASGADSPYAPLASLNAQPASAPAAASGGASAQPFNPQARQGAANSSGQFNGGYERLLNANQGVGTKIANRLTTNATTAANQAQSAIGSATNTFNGAVDQGESGFYAQPPAPTTPAPSTGEAAYLMNRFARPGAIGAGGSISDSSGAPIHEQPQMTPYFGPPVYGSGGPNATTTDPNAQYQNLVDPGSYQPQIDALTHQLAGAAYTGPTTTNGYFDDAQRQALSAAGQLSGLGSVEGRQAQLGGSLLDSLLAGSQGGAQLNKAAQGAGALGNSFGTALTNAQSRIGDTSKDLANYTDSLRGQLSTATGLQGQAQTRMQGAQQEAANRDLIDKQYKDWVEHRQKTLGFDPFSSINEDQFARMTPEQRAQLAGFRN